MWIDYVNYMANTFKLIMASTNIKHTILSKQNKIYVE